MEIVMIAMIEPDLEANPENSGSISSINPTVDPAEDLQHAAIDAVQFDNKLLRIGRKMVNESCNHKWCTILRNECFQKFSDQCGSGCHESFACWELSRCKTITSLATYGFFCLPCWIILPFFVIASFFVDSSSCSSQSTENKLLPTSASTCERACGCKGCWAFLLLFLAAPCVALYTILGPYAFSAVCGPLYMQRHFHWDNVFATDSDTKILHDSPPYEISSPFTIDEGPCVLSQHAQNGHELPCVESPGYPQPYPRDATCSVQYNSATAGSLTAVDFSTSVGDTLNISWDGLECGNSASQHAPLKRYLRDDGVEEFSGMVGGPCNFTCTHPSGQSDAVKISWEAGRSPLINRETFSGFNNTILREFSPTETWKICFDPNGRKPHSSSNLQCVAPAYVCTPKFFFGYLIVGFAGALGLVAFGVCVCCCGQCIGRCCDACCLMCRGGQKVCCGLVWGACNRFEARFQSAADARDGLVRARDAAYDKLVRDIQHLPVVDTDKPPPDICAWKMWVCWDRYARMIDCCNLGTCQCGGQLKHCRKRCCGLCCRFFSFFIVCVGLGFGFVSLPVCPSLPSRPSVSNASWHEQFLHVLNATWQDHLLHIRADVCTSPLSVAIVVFLCCCLLTLLLILHFHRALETKCHRDRLARLQSLHAGLAKASDYVVAADFNQALKMIAMTSKAFPSDPALVAGPQVVCEMLTRHANLISGARAALDAHAFFEARQQALQACVMCPAHEQSNNLKQEAEAKLNRCDECLQKAQRLVRCGDFAQAIAQVEDMLNGFPQNDPLSKCMEILSGSAASFNDQTASADALLRERSYAQAIERAEEAAQLCRTTDALIAKITSNPLLPSSGDPVDRIEHLRSLRNQARRERQEQLAKEARDARRQQVALERAKAALARAAMTKAAGNKERRPERRDLEVCQVDVSKLEFEPAYDRFYLRFRQSNESSHKHDTFWSGELAGRDYPYFCPGGWRRFSLKIQESFDKDEFWKDSTIMYHGTDPRFAAPIVEHGFRPQECQHGMECVYLSPSIIYAAHPRYARVIEHRDYFYQVVLEVRVKTSLISGFVGETMAVGEKFIIDPNFKDNSSMEFLFKASKHVKAEDGLVTTGLMMRCVDIDPLKLPESEWWTCILKAWGAKNLSRYYRQL